MGERRTVQKLAKPSSLEYVAQEQKQRDPVSTRWKEKSTPKSCSLTSIFVICTSIMASGELPEGKKNR